MFYWCFLLTVFSYQKTVGRNTRTVYKTQNIAAAAAAADGVWFGLVWFSPSPPRAFEFRFWKHKSSKQSGCCWVCLPRAAVCTKPSAPGLDWVKIQGLFLLPGMGAAAEPHLLPFFQGDTEGNSISFWGVAACLLQNGSLLRVFCSSVPLVASAHVRFVDLCSPEPGLRAELGRRGKWVTFPLEPESGEAPHPGCSSVPITNRTCGRINCTRSCDNTNVGLFFCLFFFFMTHQRCLQKDFFFF